MFKKLHLALFAALLLALLFAAAVGAQEGEFGRIRGMVIRDTNNNGECAGTGEPPLANVPIRFAVGDTLLFLQSGADGTFELSAAGLGTWQVTAEPTADQGVVTSQNPLSAFIENDGDVVDGLAFCVGTAITAAPEVLPEAGAPAMPQLWLAALVGVVLVLAGAVLYWRERLSRG